MAAEPHGHGETLSTDWGQSEDFRRFTRIFVDRPRGHQPFWEIKPDETERDPVAIDESLPAAVHEDDLTEPPVDADPENLLKHEPDLSMWSITQEQRDEIRNALQEYERGLSDFALPPAAAIDGYLATYLEHIDIHLPILHTATYRPQASPGEPELILAICANGAYARRERHAAIRLFRASKAIINMQWKRHGTRMRDVERGRDHTTRRFLRTMQAALLLSAMTILHGQETLIQETASLRSGLVTYVRSQPDNILEGPVTGDTNWRRWIFQESERRTRCAIFNVLNLHTIAFNAVPALPSQHLRVNLPCAASQWRAPSEAEWREESKDYPRPSPLSYTYKAIFDELMPYEPSLSSFGDLVVVNAILQRIWLRTELYRSHWTERMRPFEIMEVDKALQRWTHTWRRGDESVLDAHNPGVSHFFTATSYLSLAYVRLYFTHIACSALSTAEPRQAAYALVIGGWLRHYHSPFMPLLYAAQALVLPASFGVESLGSRAIHHWDIENCIWHLEAAVFLSVWLLDKAKTQRNRPLTEFELRFMNSLHLLVQKAESSFNREFLPIEAARGYQVPVNLADSLRRRVPRLWACFYRQHHSPWGLVQHISSVLTEYAKLMAERSL